MHSQPLVALNVRDDIDDSYPGILLPGSRWWGQRAPVQSACSPFCSAGGKTPLPVPCHTPFKGKWHHLTRRWSSLITDPQSTLSIPLLCCQPASWHSGRLHTHMPAPFWGKGVSSSSSMSPGRSHYLIHSLCTFGELIKDWWFTSIGLVFRHCSCLKGFFSVSISDEAPKDEAWVPHVILLTLHNLLPFVFSV